MTSAAHGGCLIFPFPDPRSLVGNMLFSLSGWDSHHGFVTQRKRRRTAKKATSIDETHGRKQNIAHTLREVQVEPNGPGDLDELENPTWDPIWLSFPILGGVTTILSLLAACLVLVWHFNVQEGGFSLITSNHYTWTYGPTALLVCVVAFWRQIDFHFKITTPWAVLQQKPMSGCQNVLLDYVSPIHIAALARAASNKHFVVVASILGFMLLKAVTLVSTGLFVVVPTTIQQSDMTLLQTANFDGLLYNQSSFPTLNDSSLLYTAYGILTQGLTYPEGTSADLAYETFRPNENFTFTNLKVTAGVRAVVPSFHCESAPVAVTFEPANTTDLHPSDRLQLQFPECRLLQGGKGTPVYALNPQLFRCPPRQLSPLVQRIECFDETGKETGDNWQLLTLADMRYNQTLSDSNGSGALGDSIQASSWYTSVAQITGIACRAAYTVEHVNVTYDYSKNPTEITVARPPGGSTEKLDGVTNFDLGRLFTASLSAASGMFGDVLFGSYAEEYPNTMFKAMAQLAGGGYEALLDEPTMIQSAEAVFQQVTIQIARKVLVRSAASTLQGQASYQQQRLEVNGISLWLMFSGFIILVVVTVGLIIGRKQNVVPRNPESVLSAALILRRNHHLHDFFRTAAGHPEEHLVASCNNRLFSSETPVDDVGQRSFILPVSEPLADDDRLKVDTILGWWQPLSVRRAFVLVTLVLPLSVITALEVVQRESDNDDGIATISNADSLAPQVLTRYIPALVMLLVSTMFNSMDFTISLLAPYNALRSGVRSGKYNIPSCILGLMPPRALLVASQNRYWGPVFSTAAALLGSVLTIFTSGLYTTEFSSLSMSAQVQRTDSFTTVWNNSVLNDSNAAVLTSLSESRNLSYTQFTSEELALPGVQAIGGQNKTASNEKVVLSIELPALRASLNCSSLSQSQMNITTFFSPRSGTSAFIQARFPLPQECQLGGPGGNLTALEFGYSFQLPFGMNSSFVGKMLDIHVGHFDDVKESSSGELSPTTQKDNPPGCPSLAFIYGYVDANTAADENVTTTVCYQQMEQIPVAAVLSLPGMSIPLDSPPVPDESRVKKITSGQDGQLAFPYRLQVHMDKELSMFNQTVYDSSNDGQTTVDGFFQAVLFGKSPIPQYFLSDPRRATDVQTAIQAFYRRYMAQVISAIMRIPTPAAQADSITGTVIYQDGLLRVKQDKESKIALQILLGVMFVCGTLAVSLSALREILPYNPTTIAGQMALWAGSRFCDTGPPPDRLECDQHSAASRADAADIEDDVPDLPQGAEFMCDKELLRTGALDGWVFRLGWWEMKDGHQRYGIDTVRKQGDWGEW